MTRLYITAALAAALSLSGGSFGSAPLGVGGAVAQEQPGAGSGSGSSNGSGGGSAEGAGGLGSGGLGNGGSGFGAPTGSSGSGAIEAPSPESLKQTPTSEESGAPEAATEAGSETAEDGLQAAPEGLVASPMALTAEESNPIDALSAGAKATVPNIAGTGNLSTSVAIQVPAFHGLEPEIGLSYDSSRKTRLSALYQGWLGHGWGLDGFDVIERASPGYGVPSFDASDVYLFNGSQLVTCGSGVTSPSCSTGGTHATENESYRRIAFNGNEWKVTDRDGTVSTFKSVAILGGLSPASGTPAYDLGYNYRWLLSSITDTNANTVSFTYTCPASPVCYPNAVTYTGAEIRFYYETRPDYILMANGLDISETTKRIRSIGIKVGAAQRDV